MERTTRPPRPGLSQGLLVAAQLEARKRDIRVIHYTMVKPFTRDNKNYALVPMGELAANARRRGKSEFGGIFAEEMETWAQAWKETYAMYGEKLENCMLLSNTPGDRPS